MNFLFETVEISPVVIKLYFRFRGTQNPIGEVINKYEKIWLNSASKTATLVLGLSDEQAGLVAELVLTLRLGYAHRVATSGKPKVSKERAIQSFSFIHSLISG